MTFEAHISTETDIQLIYIARITGLPYIFSNHPCPADWDTGGGYVTIAGESYQWVQSLYVTEQLTAIAAKAETKRGIGVTGSLVARFQIAGTEGFASDDAWLDITNGSLNRADYSYSTLAADLEPGDTTATVSTTTGWDGSGDFYVGPETITYSGKTAGTGLGDATFTGLTGNRGRYGSHPIHHPGSLESAVETGSGGAHIASGPLTLKNRYLEVWAERATVASDGTYEPVGASAMTSSGREIYRGVIVDWKPATNLLAIEVFTQTLDQEAARQAFYRGPKAKAGREVDARGYHMIQVDESNQFLYFTLRDVSTGNEYVPKSLGVAGRALLIRDDGAGGSETVPNGRYNYKQIGAYIDHTIKNTTLTKQNDATTTTLDWADFELAPSTDVRWSLLITPKSAAPDKAEIQIQVLQRSLWAELGWTEGQGTRIDDDGGGQLLEADKKCAWFRWPLDEGASRRLYYHDHTGPDFDAQPLWADDGGTLVDGYLRIGDKELVGFTFVSTANHYVEVDIRNAMGSLLEEEIYIEYNPEDDKRPELVQVPAFPNTSFLRAALYLMLGMNGDGENDSTWDKGWRGSGAGIPADLVDIDSFTDLNNQLNAQWGRNHIVRESMELRSWLKDELILNPIFLGATSDGTGHKIRALRVQPPNEEEEDLDTTHVVDHSVITSAGGVTFDASPTRIINQVKLKLEYDPASGKFFHTIDQRNVTSIGTYGPQDPITIEVRGIVVDSDGALALAERISQRIFAAYSWPYAVVELDIASFEAWGWEIGDTVLISHEALPTLDSVGRSWGNVLGRIYAIQKYYKQPLGFSPSNKWARITAIVRRYDGRRFGAWARSVYLSAKASDTNWTAEDNTYSRAADGKDLDHIQPGYRMIAFNPGQDHLATEVEVATVNPSTGAITFTGLGCALSAPVIIEDVDYDNANITAAQRKRVFIGSYDPPAVLDNGTTDDNAYTYS